MSTTATPDGRSTSADDHDTMRDLAGGAADHSLAAADGGRRKLSLHHRLKLVFVAASLLSLALSVGLWIAGEQMQAIFVGLWVPSIHSLGTLVLTGEGPR